jgi:adenosylcobyric acid synthase
MAEKKTKFIMVQGTMSNAGKSLVVAGLCRVFAQDGYLVAPFKSQNMALNSYITEDGLEMGRAQVMQAEAAGIKPSVYMNPILLKPTTDVGSQVIVNGKVLGNMKARDYFAYKKKLIPDIIAAVDELSKDVDIIVIEGAGSPAEINLKENDIVNMGMAELVDAPVLLVGDIDRGGVFAQLYGTLELLEPKEKERVKGLIINKFRGDKTILDPGVTMIEEKGGVPVVGVLPYMNISLDDEDSLSERFYKNEKKALDIAVIRLPHISNFTDFNVFDEYEEVGVRYIKSVRDLGDPDMLIIPGSKSTVADMKWLRESGLDAAIQKYADKGGIVFGICGGFQMLGERIEDPSGVEGGGEVNGIGLLPVVTTLEEQKVRKQVEGTIENATGGLEGFKGLKYIGYEIHMGNTHPTDENGLYGLTENKTGYCKDNVYGTYIHGIFDGENIASTLIKALADKKGIELKASEQVDYKAFKESQYDVLAEMIREYMDLDTVYRMIGVEPGTN